jgi:uncharacterized glyoxalase superfamily protein PhnB
MGTQISPMLAVSDPAAAIEFYEKAFGAVEQWRIEGGGFVVAGLKVEEAEFFLAGANPPGTLGPDTIGGTTVRIELFVDDPVAVQDRAVAAGATAGSAVIERTHETVDGSSFTMLQGGVKDPFGHTWLIGKFL